MALCTSFLPGRFEEGKNKTVGRRADSAKIGILSYISIMKKKNPHVPTTECCHNDKLTRLDGYHTGKVDTYHPPNNTTWSYNSIHWREEEEKREQSSLGVRENE
jgi:hypothetical protein